LNNFILIQLNLEIIETLQTSMMDANNLIGVNMNDYNFNMLSRYNINGRTI